MKLSCSVHNALDCGVFPLLYKLNSLFESFNTLVCCPSNFGFFFNSIDSELVGFRLVFSFDLGSLFTEVVPASVLEEYFKFLSSKLALRLLADKHSLAAEDALGSLLLLARCSTCGEGKPLRSESLKALSVNFPEPWSPYEN